MNTVDFLIPYVNMKKKRILKKRRSMNVPPMESWQIIWSEKAVVQAEIDKYNRLILRLTEEGKNEMIIQIAADNALREKWYK